MMDVISQTKIYLENYFSNSYVTS